MGGASVIVRSRDSESTIERALRGLRDQTVAVQIVVVDSGSTDGTTEIARRYCDRLIEIPPGEFTYGGALNAGAAQADGEFQFALSSHCAPRTREWVERSLAHYERSEVAGTSGYRPPGPAGQAGVVLQDMAMLRSNPYWGYSNTAGSWRAELWRRFPFSETLEAAEDREWSWRVLEAGNVIAMDPALEVVSRHRVSQGLPALYRRYRAEARAISGFASPAPYRLGEALSDWWAVAPRDSRSPARLRASPWHIAATAARYSGARSARRAA